MSIFNDSRVEALEIRVSDIERNLEEKDFYISYLESEVDRLRKLNEFLEEFNDA